MPIPFTPKIYHIVHVDRLASIIADGVLWCDAEIRRNPRPGTTIGMPDIKERRLSNRLNSRPGLHVGNCVPFYFCPRSVMLYLIHMKNHQELSYRGGQEPIVHLEADVQEVVCWAEQDERRWAFTLSNAGSSYFQDRCKLGQLSEINWEAIQARNWQDPELKEGKQAEFLVEHSFPWSLVQCIGVRSAQTQHQGPGGFEDGRAPARRPTQDVLVLLS